MQGGGAGERRGSSQANGSKGPAKGAKDVDEMQNNRALLHPTPSAYHWRLMPVVAAAAAVAAAR